MSFSKPVSVTPSADVAFMKVGAMKSPGLADITSKSHLLLMNGMVAVSLNFIAPTFMKATSALGVTLTGLLKDIVIVSVSGLVLKELISSLQIFGFLLQIFGIGVWGMMKLYPKHFNEGFFTGFYLLLSGKPSLKDMEKTPLAQDAENPKYAGGRGLAAAAASACSLAPRGA